MSDYRVIWEIDIIADTPAEAAQKAREIQLRPDNQATFFQVLDKANELALTRHTTMLDAITVSVDLNPEEVDGD